MNRRGVLLGSILLLFAGCGGAGMARSGDGTVTVTDARIEPTSAPTDNRSAVVTLTMIASADDELIGAAVPAAVAGKAAIEGTVRSAAGHLGHLDAPGAPPHTHETTDRIKLPKGVVVQLKAGVGRIVLDQVGQPIRSGDHFSLTLTFASGATQTVSVNAKTVAAPTGDAQRFTVIVDGTDPTVGAVTKGALVSITVSNPTADDEFHLHGYDLTEKAVAGKTATFTFVATDPGTFDLESHASNRNLFRLTVSQ
jgi:copper(I)-binding protein